MSIVERLASLASREAVRWVADVDDQLKRPSAKVEDEFHSTALRETRGLSPDSLEALLGRDTPRFGVYGAGLYRSGAASRLRPAVFVLHQLLGLPPSSSLIEMSAHEIGLSGLLKTASDAIPNDALVVALPLPLSEARISAGGPIGTVGIPVSLADGAPGVLTAGHVAPVSRVAASIEGRPSGMVVFSDHRGLHRFPESSPDVAAIRLSSERATELPVPNLLGIAQGAELELVRALNSSGVGGDGQLVRAIVPRFAVDERGGAWAEIVTVDAAISEPGDSGSVVLNRRNEVVGHVVGGHPPAYSLVQDAELLLTATGAQLRPS